MKTLINKILQPFNAEIHGKGYLQSLANSDFRKDAFYYQKDFYLGEEVNVIFDLGIE